MSEDNKKDSWKNWFILLICILLITVGIMYWKERTGNIEAEKYQYAFNDGWNNATIAVMQQVRDSGFITLNFQSQNGTIPVKVIREDLCSNE